MVFMKYAPAAVFALFVAFAFIGYSVTGAEGALLLGLGMGFVVGSWAAKTVEPKLAQVELRKRLRRMRK
jgi:hypothetical protein